MKIGNTFGSAGVTADQALALAAEAEVRAFSYKVPLGYPSGRAVIVKKELQRQVGNLNAFNNALLQYGFVVSDRMASGGRVMIGVIDAVRDFVNGVITSSGETEEEIETKYHYAISAYKRSKEAFEANQKSLNFKAAAFVLSLKQENTTFSKRELAEMLGEADIEGVIACVRNLGISVEKVDEHESGFMATADTEDTVYWLFEVADMATLATCQEAAIGVAWPADEEENDPIT